MEYYRYPELKWSRGTAKKNGSSSPEGPPTENENVTSRPVPEGVRTHPGCANDREGFASVNVWEVEGET